MFGAIPIIVGAVALAVLVGVFTITDTAIINHDAYVIDFIYL